MSGIAQALGSVLGGNAAEQYGADQEMARQTKIAQALATIKASDAAAKLHEAQAADVAAGTQRAAARPGIVDAALAASAGVDVPTLNAWRQRHSTGQAPQVPMGPPTEDGSMGQGAFQLPAEASTRIGQALGRFLPASTAEKDINPEQWAKAQGLYQDQDQEAAVAAGTMSPMALAVQRYAAKGNAPYHFGADGAVGNQLTGSLDTSNPMAQGTIKLKGAQANQANSAAGASNAHAGLFRAQTDEVRNGPKGQFDSDRGVLVDPRSGTARPVLGPDGMPLGPKDKPLPEAAQKQVLGARNLQDAVGVYLAQLEKFGLSNMASPDDRAIMGNAYNNMMLQAKEAYNLGVLNGPDYEILQSVVKDPTKWSAAFVSRGALADQAGRLRSIAANIEKTALEGHGKPYVPRQPSGAPSGGGPAIGTVDGGYRFKGGDPSNAANWEKVK